MDLTSLESPINYEDVRELFHIGLSEDRSEEMYVSWVDLMGTKKITSRSNSEAGIKTFKLHTAAKLAYEAVDGDQEGLFVSPLMDGVYSFCTDKITLIKYLHNIYALLAEDVVEEDRDRFVYAIKGAIAYGPVIRGDNIEDGIAALEDTNHEELTAVGLPIVQAFEHEQKAPPFGVYVHESARAFAPDDDDPFRFVWWRWYESKNTNKYDRENLARDLHERISDYYNYCEDNTNRINYCEDRIAKHRDQVNEYFPDFEN